MSRDIQLKLLAFILANFAFLVATGGSVLAAQQSRIVSAPVVLVKDDSDPAARAIFTAAARGNPKAQTQLGFMYEYGRGVPQSYDFAVRWYQCAAQQGDANAQYLLGLMYEKGHGVEQSDILAYTWLNLAAAHAAPRVREYYAHIRDAVANKLTPAQMGNAQFLAQDFVAKSPP